MNTLLDFIYINHEIKKTKANSKFSNTQFLVTFGLY